MLVYFFKKVNQSRKILDLLRDVPHPLRKAKFVCVITIARPDGKFCIIKSICKGVITKEPKGDSGFGYDPIFFIPRYNKTFAEMDADLKNRISQRGKALKKAQKIL